MMLDYVVVQIMFVGRPCSLDTLLIKVEELDMVYLAIRLELVGVSFRHGLPST